jgi:hypothetical protein
MDDARGGRVRAGFGRITTNKKLAEFRPDCGPISINLRRLELRSAPKEWRRCHHFTAIDSPIANWSACSNLPIARYTAKWIVRSHRTPGQRIRSNRLANLTSHPSGCLPCVSAVFLDDHLPETSEPLLVARMPL